MPEYLAPGVYVEEIDVGAKPIEGVSTSTAGLIGFTERGPEHIPILVTSTGDFARTFGGYLNRRDVMDPSGQTHNYLPHAVGGFFPNGGRRAYIVRVLPEDATRARRNLFDRGAAGSAATMLIRPAAQGTGTAVNLPLLYALDVTNIDPGDHLRIGDGSRAEYREVASTATDPRHVALNFPLQMAHTAQVPVIEVARKVDTPKYTTGDFRLEEDAAGGSTSIVVSAITTAADLTTLVGLPGGSQLIEIGTTAVAEYVTVTGAVDLGGGEARLTLSTPLVMDYAEGVPIFAIEIPAPATSAILDLDANAGDMIIYLDDLSGAFSNTANLIVVDSGGMNPEVRRIGDLNSLPLDLGSYAAYGIGSIVQLVIMADDDRQVAVAAGDPNTASAFDLDRVDGLAIGMTISVGGTDVVIQTVDHDATRITILPALGAAPAPGTAVAVRAKTLTAAVAAGGIVLSLDNRLGLEAGDVIRLGVAPDEEYVTIAEVRGPREVAPDAGTVVLTRPLRQFHLDGTPLRRQHPPTLAPSRQSAFVFLAANENDIILHVNDGSHFSTNEVVRVTLPSGTVYYHRLSGNTIDLDPREVTFTESLSRSHEVGMPLVERSELIEVEALDRGDWGNRLLISVEDERPGLVTRAELNEINPPLQLRLTTLTGVEAGTLLTLADPATSEVIGPPLKVRSIDRAANNLVVLDPPGLQPVHIGAHNTAVLGGTRLQVRSIEFRLTVHLRQPPDPAVPSRNDTIIDSEAFRYLSMDPRHSQYIETMIGAINGELRLWDRRPEGASVYIRVRDLATNAAEAESPRPGPETLTDILPSGQPRAARHPLGDSQDSRGNNSASTMGDAMYLGDDNIEPELRTGIHAFKNILNLSLVAAPGQTSVAVQQALIDHCEEQRYRFAVLDAQGPTVDTLADIQNQRQQFDSKYAALYHPWLLIPETFPQNLANIRQMAIPPSGHVLGIYARSDNNRGVHKAPANEVVRNIIGLARSLNQAEHDILNPQPTNINVIRDFRVNNRGIRVWGARCITSDSDFKYVNIRRLLIFLEDSIDRGLQWVVFEPNAEPLWARVRRSITSFLTSVWRDGALEGTTTEQAFFVKCDRTTMTQSDIDNGRLICVIGVAPVKPAEFVIIRLGLLTADSQQ